MGDGLAVEMMPQRPGERVLVSGGAARERVCPHCKRPFPPARPHQRYCTDHCRIEAWKTKPRQATLPGESRVERQFREWIESEDGRRVESEVVRRAARLQAQGFRKYGIAALIEAIRYDHAVKLIGPSDGYRINNNVRSLLARRVMEQVPELEGFFATRDLRGVR